MAELQTDNPIGLFQQWLSDAKQTDMVEPTAMSLATATRSGMPSVRMVLLKAADERGFVFYTNLGSRKARELDENPQAALCMHFPPLRRQVRVAGVVEPVSAEEADAYFASRARTSRIGAWASRQSEVMPESYALEKRVAYFTARFAVGEVPRPEFWSGYRIVPHEIEFWVDREYRLHERIRYTRPEPAAPWQADRLFP